MGFQSIVHGRIVIENNLDKVREIIQNLGNDEWMLRTEMFGLGISDQTYYEDPVISFGATYKQIEYYWAEFILEFENILRQIDFDTAKIQLETEIMGTYNFFWKSKKDKTSYEKEAKMIETEEWFFGFGNRDRWGLLETDLLEEEIFTIDDFKYPIIDNSSQ
ncbi:hypothetical protein HX13_19045 [Chryseobacterium sp. P1-3]|uniref:DUF600 family protein n=1 Tax=Chryseobacterium gallinarum TaxID=1324352 RepID=A0A0G3LYN6_CHRGL|nr:MULTISPECIES: hypothetical protein [Chryseobacterium]AKK72016.1 hypothetical protein OK18_04635 [Chryseobacterium gallinarum]KFF73556.1 hypothetical protein HX13_19045 [Chryseobacterium sp. P1-3]QIY92326.1 hypothetical protein FOB44_17405 [Chryseobacterium gallinarum]